MQNAAIISLALINIALVSLSQIALWQRKEYRLDRMKSYLTSPEGSLIQHRAPLIAALLVGLAWLIAFRDSGNIVEYISVASLLVVFIGHAVRIQKKGVIRPTVTTRSTIVMVGVALVCILWVRYLIVPGILTSLQLATLLFFLPAIIALVVAVIAIPATIQKKRVISQARAHRASLSNLTVVGITGSVGKTSTKAYLLHILGGESATVRATSEHRNAPYVIAQDMLGRLTKKTTTYIAEMGAYTKGEIAELSRLTKPKVGVVTAITNQHTALFGSLANLARAKWELIDALPEDGIAVLNADDERITKKAKRLQKKAIWFSTNKKADVYMKGTALTIDDQTYTVQLPVIGRGQVASAVAAAAAAHALGIPAKTIVRQLESLPSLPQTMEHKKGKNGMTVIDDSYSASEASVMNAIEYLKGLPKGDKRLVMVPVIELGSEGQAVHRRIGKVLSELDAMVYIYGTAYMEDIQKGLGVSPAARVQWISDARHLAQEVTTDCTSATTILLEGRVPSLIRMSVV